MAHLECSFYSNSLKKNARIQVVIPTRSADEFLSGDQFNYSRSHAKFQTLYLLHGSYGDCTDWSRFTNVERYAQEQCLAVVMPSAENSNYVNMAHGEKYLDYISQELPYFLSELLPLSDKKEDTFIAGLSMGGYGAFRLAFEHPEKYACAASLSGALDKAALQESTDPHITKMSMNYRKAVFADIHHVAGSENDLSVLLKKKMAKKVEMPKLYMTCGTEDFIYPSNVEFYDEAQKYPIDLTFEKHPGIHCWEYWDMHIKDVLKWLPLKHNTV